MDITDVEFLAILDDPDCWEPGAREARLEREQAQRDARDAAFRVTCELEKQQCERALARRRMGKKMSRLQNSRADRAERANGDIEYYEALRYSI
jgi:hypothetical protein